MDLQNVLDYMEVQDDIFIDNPQNHKISMNFPPSKYLYGITMQCRLARVHKNLSFSHCDMGTQVPGVKSSVNQQI